MKQRSAALAILLCATTLRYLGAERIIGFSYEGLRAVRAELVDRVTGRFVGESADGESERRIIAELRALGLFSDVAVRWENPETGGGAIGVVSLEERNTFVALPMGGVKNGSAYAGAAIVESNLFGMGTKLAAVARIGEETRSASIRYAGPFAAGPYRVMGSARFDSGAVSATDAGGNEFSRFSSTDVGAEAAAGIRIGEVGEAAIGAGIASRAVDSRDDGRNAPKSLTAPIVAFSAKRVRSTWDGTFDSESSISAGIALHATTALPVLISGEFAFRGPLIRASRISVTGSFGCLTRDELLLNPDSQAIQSFLMPASFNAPTVACAGTETEAALFKTGLGTVSAFAGYEVAAGAGGIGGAGVWQGPKAGLRLYFRKVPLPGAALTAGYDLNGTGVKFSLTLGIKA